MGGGRGADGGGVEGMEAERQFVKGKTSVWWDIENCQVPKGCDPHAIAQNISSALAKLNYSGPVSVSAYGDTTRIPSAVQQALSSTGIALNHVPAGVKDASDKKILVDMLFWAVDNPAPANYLLISGDVDFSNALHQLRMRRYNILLAQPQKVSAPLLTAAKTVWLWTSLLAGGPPLTKVESQRLSNNAGVSSSLETFQVPVSNAIPEKQPSNIPFETSNFGHQKLPEAGRDNDPKQMGKTNNRNMVDSIPRNKYQTNANYQHGAYDLQGPPPGPVTTGNRDLPRGHTNGQGNYQTHYPLRSRPNNFPFQTAFPPANVYPLQANIYPPRNPPFGTSQMMPPRPDGPCNTQGPSSISNLKISSGPSGVPNPPNFHQQNGGMKMSAFPPASVYPLQANIYPHYNPPFGTSPMMPPRPDGPSSTQCPPHISNLNTFGGPSGVPNPCNFHKQNGEMKMSAFPPANAYPLQANVYPPHNPLLGTSPMMLLRPDGPRSTHGLPDATNLNISGGPSSVPNPPNFCQQKSTPAKNKPSIYHNKKNEFPTVPEYQYSTSSASSSPDIPSNDTLGTPGNPKPSEYIQGLVEVIIVTLDTLKNEKIMPTEANIVDCIRYGDPKHGNTDVRKGLECAMEQQMIVQQNIGAVQLYIGKNEELWKCIDPSGGDAKDYPQATWTEIKNFLTTSTGRSTILASQCRYEASTFIKRLCLKQLALGEVLQILNMTLTVKRWIIHHQSGWQPLKIVLAEANTSVPEYHSSTLCAPSSPDIPGNCTWGTPGYSEPSEYIQGLVEVILLTLDTLKNEKIMPTEVNIVDCIQYGDPKHRNTDVRKGLESAVEQQMIMQQNIGTVQLYVHKNEELWKCVDPLGGNVKDYPKATWAEIKNFLTSSAGRFAILTSRCRYEAGTIIKRLCLKQLALGEVLQILIMTITVKRWIIQHESGWQPLKIVLAEANIKSTSPVKSSDDGSVN